MDEARPIIRGGGAYSYIRVLPDGSECFYGR